MFDDIGNLVYIIVFAIWFLYRVFGKARKKTARPMPPFDSEAPEPSPQEYRPTEAARPTEPTRPTINFEDILRELTGAPATPQPIPEVVPEFEEDYPYKEDYPIDDIGPTLEEASFEVHDTAKKVEPISSFLRERRSLGFQIKKHQTSKAARAAFKMMQSKHGAKQAFIMKEIFDRPYS